MSASRLPQRRLGTHGPLVPAIGLGCRSLTGVYGDADDAAPIALIHHDIAVGANPLDSVDIYGGGHNETVIGGALHSGL